MTCRRKVKEILYSTALEFAWTGNIVYKGVPCSSLQGMICVDDDVGLQEGRGRVVVNRDMNL